MEFIECNIIHAVHIHFSFVKFSCIYFISIFHLRVVFFRTNSKTCKWMIILMSVYKFDQQYWFRLYLHSFVVFFNLVRTGTNNILTLFLVVYFLSYIFDNMLKRQSDFAFCFRVSCAEIHIAINNVIQKNTFLFSRLGFKCLNSCLVWNLKHFNMR